VVVTSSQLVRNIFVIKNSSQSEEPKLLLLTRYLCLLTERRTLNIAIYLRITSFTWTWRQWQLI